MVITSRILINKPAHDVFHIVAHFENEPQWNPLVATLAKVSEGPIGTGTLWQETLSLPLIRPIQTRRLTAYIPDRAIAFENASGFPVRVAYRFVRRDKGNRTLLIASSLIELAGPYRIFGPVARPVVQLMTMFLLRKLRKLAEAAYLPRTRP